MMVKKLIQQRKAIGEIGTLYHRAGRKPKITDAHRRGMIAIIRKAREAWAEKSRYWHPGCLVFIDESGAKTNMTSLHGRAMKGERARDCAPHGHGCVRTMISSVRADGTESS